MPISLFVAVFIERITGFIESSTKFAIKFATKMGMLTGLGQALTMLNQHWILGAACLCLCGSSAVRSAASNTVVQASQRYTVQVWEADDGLPQNSVIAMTQTRDGYLWLGTLNGLVRFDGLRFTVFDEGNTPGLKSSRIVKLFEDSQDRLWVGTDNAGVVVIQDGQVTRPPELSQGGAERRLMAACEDAQGAVWLYHANGELWRCWQGRFTPFFHSPDGPSSTRSVIAEPTGPVWVGTDRRQLSIGPIQEGASFQLPVERDLPVTKLDFLLPRQRGGHWRLADGGVQQWTTNRLEREWGAYPWGYARISAACEDREGNLLVGTLGAGLFWFDAEGKATSLSTNQGLSNNSILSLHVDRDGSLWVGTDGGGLNRVKRQAFEVLNGTQGLTVQSACEDAQGGLWIGFNSIGIDPVGAGYWKDNILQRFGPRQGLVNASVSAVFVDRSRQVWVGTKGAGLFQFEKGKFQRAPGAESIPQVILAIHEDRSGRLWLGTQGGLVRQDGQDWKLFTTQDGLSSDEVQALADDAEGNLWIGTVGGGLNRWRDGKFTSYHVLDGLPGEDVYSLHFDSEGVLWIGTRSGLGRWHEGKWTHYTTREGLISNSLGYMTEDGQGYLWIGSNAGLMRVPKQALNDFARGVITFIPCRAYLKLDGLPSRECTRGSQPGACRTRDGKFWFPTVKGLVSVNPAQLYLNTNPPPVMIESVFIEGLAQNTNRLRAAWPRGVTMPAGKEWLEIHYTTLNLAAPDRARFRYRLEGHETAWTEADNARVARYSKLPPGHYRFQVSACNEDGVWNNAGSSLALIVEPPFWRTWWFVSAAVAGLLGAIVAVVHYLSTQKLQHQLAGLRQQEALEKERARIARDIHDQLGASLTQVALLGEMVESDKDSPADVEAHARQISQTARETARGLDEIVWTVNPSNDTLDALITYVCKYAQEYLAVAGLRYRLEVPAQLPATPIPPEVRHNLFLAAKETVTNVVRHARASTVWIRLRLEPGTFTLEIEDNGCGLANRDEQRAQTRSGLRNLQKRMEEIGGRCTFKTPATGGTLVELVAPLAGQL